MPLANDLQSFLSANQSRARDELFDLLRIPSVSAVSEHNADTARAADTAGLIIAFSKDAPIALAPEDFAPAPWLGLLGFVGVIVWLYGWMLRRACAASPPSGPPAGTLQSSFAHRPSSVAPA